MADRLHELHGGRDAGDSFLILRSRFGALRRAVGRRVELRKRQRFEKILAGKKDSDVRSVEFVCGYGEKVAIDRLHIDRFVRSEMHGIDEKERADGFRDFPYGSQIVDCADRV